MKQKVVIIGCGNVGMSYAYALLNQRTAVNELVLIDLNNKRIEGEVMDLNHCLAFAPSKINIKVGTYEDCKDAKIVCIAAGTNQNSGETRMDLIKKNSSIFESIVKNVMNSGFNGIFLVATNPLDVMTYLTWKYSNLPARQIIGSGTSLDTARLRYLIGEKVGVNPKNVHAYVIGEHGDSEFVPWSSSAIGLQSINEHLDKKILDNISEDVKNAAYEIIDRKGATYYGIGMSLVYITNSILGNENSIITVSTYDDKNEIFIGMPCIIGENGIKEKLNVELNNEENNKLINSINTIKEAIQSLE